MKSSASEPGLTGAHLYLRNTSLGPDGVLVWSFYCICKSTSKPGTGKENFYFDIGQQQL